MSSDCHTTLFITDPAKESPSLHACSPPHEDDHHATTGSTQSAEPTVKAAGDAAVGQKRSFESAIAVDTNKSTGLASLAGACAFLATKRSKEDDDDSTVEPLVKEVNKSN